MATPQTVAFHTLGCKLNYSETSAIRRRFENIGYTTVEWSAPSDIYVLNTCSVTEFADKKCRAEVRKVLRQSPDAKIVVIGCYAQLKPDSIAEIPGVDLVLGAAEKFAIDKYIDHLSKAPGKGMVKAGEISEVNSFHEAFSFGDRTRSFLKVQDGCDYKCTFCTIPQARGNSRSPSIDRVVDQAREIVKRGSAEIVLTGVNIGDFGLDSAGKRVTKFLNLLVALDQIEDLKRIRISSIEPNLCSEELIEFVAQSKRIMPHFHMPLQSGSDRILSLMRRRYKTNLYTDRVGRIKQLIPHCCIGVDVIVGFPGETIEDFNKTVDYLTALDVSYLHVFTYSERENTPAKEMEGVVPMSERRRRNKVLRQLSANKKNVFYRKHIEDQRPVLFEAYNDAGIMYGFTDNYIKVSTPYSPALSNQIEIVQIRDFDEKGSMTCNLEKSIAAFS